MVERSGQGQQFGKRRPPSHQITITRGNKVRRLTLPPWSLVASGAALGLFALWTAGATGFIIFRDDFIAGMVRRQAAVEYQYEDRITALKAEIARLQSKQLVDGQAFAQKIETLMSRQSSLESRQLTLQTLADKAAGAGVKALLPAQLGDDALGSAPLGAPRPLPDDAAAIDRPGKQAALGFAPPQQASVTGGGFARAKPTPRLAGMRVGDRLDAVAQSLDRVDARQVHALATLTASVTARTRSVRDALDDIGLDADALLSPADRPTAEGGPYIPAPLPGQASFEAQAQTAQAALAAVEGIDRALAAVPLHLPFPGGEVTSPFGVRLDPFFGTGALHAGIDIREETGAPVRATAAGIVTTAGWAGGYGNMVEVDHGNGLATRYGHMSEILVSPGDKIALGQIVGRVGSTGRSTGPHLHYETRIHGTAVDPMRFQRAGRLIEQAS